MTESNTMKIRGRVWKYGDDVNTDVIFPGKYTYTISEPSEMAEHALEDLDPEFAGNVSEGDIIAAGKNWGCGSSREQAVICLVAAGVGAVVVRSCARIYYRNAINNGLPVFVSEKAAEALEEGETAEIDLENGLLYTSGQEIALPQFPESVLKIMEAGGLLPYVRERLKGEKE